MAEPGSTASFNLTLTVPTARAAWTSRPRGVPDGWTARFRGGGLTIDSAFVEPKAPPTITLDVEIPDRRAGRRATRITVTATGGGRTDAPAADDPRRATPPRAT